VNMGSASCQGNLSTYDFYLIAPDGTSYQFIDNITSGTTTGWVNTTFIDNPNVERIRNDFSVGDQNLFNPWSIGYYRPNFGSGYASLNGINADGNWTFRVCRGSGNIISFNSACISFGAPVPTVDALGTNQDDCATAQCLDNTSIINADNDGTSVDPLYPGDVIDGCDWNSGNHESAWFKFQPTGSTARIVLSGLDAPSGLGYQAIVLENTLGNGCPSAASDFTVPIGGCPDDESINNTDYLSANGGGTSTAGAVYDGDINFNMEFNLSGLTPNKVYYLYVDGNTTTVDETFVVELITPGAGGGANGTVSCSVPLGVELLNFNVFCHDGFPELTWQTASEMNNEYFEVQHTSDGINFTSIGFVNGNGTTTSLQSYQFEVDDRSLLSGYYRLKQVDFDGAFQYSPIRSVNCQNNTPFVQIINGKLIVENIDRITNCSIYDITGRMVFNSPDYTSFNANLANYFYFIILATPRGNHTFRIYNK